MTQPDDLYYDPYDYGIDADPHPVWKRMRDESPLYYNAKYDFYALSRFEDVQAGLGDWQTYSSHQGTVLETIRIPGLVDRIRNILFEDPPVHDIHRRMLTRVFTPRRVSALEPRIRKLCAEHLDPFVGSNGFDLVRDFGAVLPMLVISSLLGIPEQDQVTIRDLSDRMLHHTPGQASGENLQAVLPELMGFFAQYIAFRRANPTDDLMTDLITTEVADEKGVVRLLNDQELINYMWLVAAAGNETVARLIGWMGKLLADNPDQRRMLVKDPSLCANAVEECLRIEAPSPVQARVVTRDVQSYDRTVPEGAVILLVNGSATRDERVYADPDTFDVRRDLQQRLSLGYGVHHCLGAAVARLEGQVALEELLARFPEWDVDLTQAEMVHTSTVRGFAKLPITL